VCRRDSERGGVGGWLAGRSVVEDGERRKGDRKHRYYSKILAWKFVGLRW